MTDEQKNKDFVIHFRDTYDFETELAGKNYMAYKVYRFLSKNMDRTNALIVSNAVLQEVFECSKATICRSIKYLKDNGFICVLKSGTSNVYIVNPELSWTSYANQKEYCRFEGTILIGKSENIANSYIEFASNAKSFYKRIDLPDSMKKSGEDLAE